MRWALLVVSLVVALTLGLPGPGTASAEAKKDSGAFRGCRLQKPQAFLKRTTFVKKRLLQARSHLRALRYRVERYGNVPGLELEKINSRSAASQAKSTRFFGLPLQVHERIATALRCVERRIQKVCKSKSSRYAPRAVGGFRQGNSYRGAEVSNHLFGIAVDIDPDKNPCCGCVDPWPTHKLCQDREKPIYERTSLPRCWVRAFERYGFWWLGHDELEDTMHFEFLGDPDRVLP
jgi:hypothetical protein